MNNSRYRWVIVAAGGLLGCVAIGGMFSLPVLLQPITRNTGWSVAGVSSAMTIGFLAMAFASMIWGTLSDRIFAPFWPPNIILLCALLLTSERRWWIFIAAVFPAHVIAEIGVGMPIHQNLIAFATAACGSCRLDRPQTARRVVAAHRDTSIRIELLR